MAVPVSVAVECPMCREETLHEVLSGRLTGTTVSVLESTVRCRTCGHVHHATVKAERPAEIPVIISWLKESIRSSITIGPDEVLSVGDDIMCGEVPVLITSIEVKGGRPKRAKARDIDTIWAKRFEKVRVPFSINHLGRSYSEHILAVPDEEFMIGDILRVGKRDVVIHSIKLKDKSLRKGSAEAREIVRVYATVVRKTSY